MTCSPQRWLRVLAVGALACVPAQRAARRSEAMGGPPVTLVPRTPVRELVTAHLALSSLPGAAGEAGMDGGTVELRPRGDTILEYSLRLKGVGDGAWAAAHIMYSTRDNAADEQIGALFVGAALSSSTAQVRGTVSIGKTIPVRWLLEELQASPGRFFVILTDTRGSGTTLRGHFQ